MIRWLLRVWNGRVPAARAATLRALLVGTCLLLAGCPKSGGNAGPSSWTDVFKPKPRLTVTTAPADQDLTAGGSGGRQAVAALMLKFDVLRTQVPQGTFSESGKIWNHVDEQVVPAEMAALLQRNGLRVARGKATSWAPIKALLDAEKDVSSFGNAMTLNNGLPLIIELDAKPHDQTLFLFRPDGSWPGATLPGSMNLLRLEYEIPVDTPESVSVNVMPEVRLQAPESSLVTEGWTGQPVTPPTRVFRELAVRVLIGPDEFLAIGPSAAVRRSHTIGGLMLSQTVDGRPFECMFFITPRIVRKGLTPGMERGVPAAVPAKR
jgi:hypothetical protein